jgi:opacity protein-like surface antigen
MSRSTLTRLLPLLAIGLLLASPGAAQEPAKDAGSPPGFLARTTKGRLLAGARIPHSWLAEDRRSGPNGYDNSNKKGNFLGSLWGLDPQQSWVPYPYVEYRVVAAFGLGAAYDQLTVKTLDWANPEHTLTAGDGDLRTRGAQVYAFARYANRTRFTPYVQLGWAFYSSQFLESPGWAAPGRYFEVSGTNGWLVTAGARAALWRGLAVDASYQHLHLDDVSAIAHLAGGGRIKGAFPMQRDVVAAGVLWAF